MAWMSSLFSWVLEAVMWFGEISEWLVSPLGSGLDIAPLHLLFGAGLLTIIGIHVVRLFV